MTKLPTITDGLAILNKDKVEKITKDYAAKIAEYKALELLEQNLTNGSIGDKSHK